MNLFSKQNLKKKDKQNDNIYRLLLPSFIAICICTICLSTASWAWFTSTTSTSVSSIKAAYNLSYGINNYDKLTLIDGSATYTMDDTGTCTITLSAKDSTTDGYCIINVGDKEYYTSLISKGTDTYGFTIKASKDTVITLTPKWGALPSGIAQDNIISNEANNGSNNAIVIFALDGESADDELTTNEEDVDTDVDNKKEEEDASENKELTNEEKDNFSSGSEEENQNIEETEKQNEEPSNETSEPSDETDVTDKTTTGEDDTSLNPSSESTEADDSIDGLS